MRRAVEEAIRRQRLVAILRGVPAKYVAEMGDALMAGGISIMEVALSEPDALDALERLAAHVGDSALVGAGTVTSAELGKRALDAGARFFVTPHVVPEVCQLAVDRDVAVICGAMTPTEIALARSLGSNIVKLFPAAPLGPAYVRALLGPYPDVEALAVGGIGPSNLAEFLKAGALGGGIGGALTRQDWSHPDFTRTVQIARQLVQIVAETVRPAGVSG